MVDIDVHRRLQQALGLHRSGEVAKAAAIYRQVLQTQPGNANALHLLGAAEAAAGNLAEAKSLMERSLQAQPGDVQFIENYATILVQSGDYEAALQTCARGLTLNRRSVSLLYASAVACLWLDRLQESLAHFDQVLALQPNHIAAINERGSVLVELGRHDEALAGFAGALALNPRYAEAHFNAGLCRLLTGDFECGLPEYEWRWQYGAGLAAKRNFAQPQWTGSQDLAGKTILLHAEQGFGDAIQFCRYVPLVAARGARVILEAQRPLQALMTTLRGAAQVIARGDPLPDFDLHCPLLSLPLAFGTTVRDIPGETPYLHAAPWPVERGDTKRLRIGLAWSGSMTNKSVRNRPIPLRALLPLLDAPATFVSLQKDVRPGDAAVLQERSDLSHYGDELKDFADTAGLIASLDLIISIDTSVAHLAGALGKPLWVMLPFAADWRWLLGRDDSPWYPTARLFRQDESRTWDGVVARVRVALFDFVACGDAMGQASTREASTREASTREASSGEGHPQ